MADGKDSRISAIVNYPFAIRLACSAARSTKNPEPHQPDRYGSSLASYLDPSRRYRVPSLGMLRALLGASVLLLVSVFFAYVLAPIVESLQRRIRVGRRRRPAPRAAVIAALYLALAIGGIAAWKPALGPLTYFLRTSAPVAIDRLFGNRGGGPIDQAVTAVSRFPAGGDLAAEALRRAIRYLEAEVRTTFRDVVAASQYAAWLLVAPIVAFVLLTGAPAFRRSAGRLLPHGHLQWRAGEYLRDVNSALAGYVRAQLAAAVIVGTLCVFGFSMLQVPFAVSMGLAAGALELVPAVGPATALVMASSQAAGNQALALVAFLAALRLVQDYVIYPRLIRRGMHLATPVVIVAIWCGAVLVGAAGVIIAIPAAGFASVSLRHWREYRAIEQLVREAARRTTEASAQPPTSSFNERS
jgi:predicted PurR-regulated permease PerM